MQVRVVETDETALTLDQEVLAEFVLEILARCAVGRPQVAHVGHVVEDFDVVDVDLGEVIELPVHGFGVVPRRDEGRFELGLAAGRVEPHHHAAHHVTDGIGADGGGLGAGAVVVGDVVDVAIRAVAPGMVGAADGIALDLRAATHDHRALAGREVRAHVGTVGVEHHGLAALAAVERQIAPEVAHGHGAGVQLAALGHDEPAAGEDLGAESVISCFCHV